MLEEQRKPSNAFMGECTIDAPMLEEQRKPSSFHGKCIVGYRVSMRSARDLVVTKPKQNRQLRVPAYWVNWGSAKEELSLGFFYVDRVLVVV